MSIVKSGKRFILSFINPIQLGNLADAENPDEAITKRQFDGGVLISIKTPEFTSNNYTLVLTDGDGKSFLQLDNGSTAATLTIPKDSLVNIPIGRQILFELTGTGTMTITPDTGVTLHSESSLLSFKGQHACVSIIKKAANLYSVAGNLS